MIWVYRVYRVYGVGFRVIGFRVAEPWRRQEEWSPVLGVRLNPWA